MFSRVDCSKTATGTISSCLRVTAVAGDITFPTMKKRRRTYTTPGIKADFILEITACRNCLRRLAGVASALPDNDDGHLARNQVAALIVRMQALEEAVLRWIAKGAS